MLTPKDKYVYLQKIYGFNFTSGRHKFEVKCSLCHRTLYGDVYITRNGRAQELSIFDGNFHHDDGDANNDSFENIVLVCLQCHRRLHQLGEVLKWLKEINKKVEDFPNAIKLEAIRNYAWY